QIYHVHRRESASGALAGKTVVTIRRPGLWGAIAAAMVLFAGGGDLAFTTNPTVPGSPAAPPPAGRATRTGTGRAAQGRRLGGGETPAGGTSATARRCGSRRQAAGR